MKILYIDTESFFSHLNFNRIHLNALLSQGFTIDGAFKVGYKELLGMSEVKVVCEIPEEHYEHGKDTQLYGRYLMLRRLFDVKRAVRLKDYDAIILSYYDELVLPFAGYPSGLYMINHINIGALNHWLKKYFIKRLAHNNTHIVLSKTAYDFVKQLGIDNCRLVYHGLPKPYPKDISKPAWMNHKYCIFSPSVTSTDFTAIHELLDSKLFLDYLTSKDILFVIRGRDLYSDCPNIKIINHYMDDADYQGCFMHSDAIFVAYRKDRFKYRVSAVMLECIANNKRVIAKRSEALNEYQDAIGGESYYDTVPSVFDVLKRMIERSSEEISYSYSCEPDYGFIKSSIA